MCYGDFMVGDVTYAGVARGYWGDPGSPMLPSGHLLTHVRGAAPQACLAYRAEGGRVIVVLSSRDKLEMEAMFRRTIPEDARCGSTFVFRQARPFPRACPVRAHAARVRGGRGSVQECISALWGTQSALSVAASPGDSAGGMTTAVYSCHIFTSTHSRMLCV